MKTACWVYPLTAHGCKQSENFWLSAWMKNQIKLMGGTSANENLATA